MTISDCFWTWEGGGAQSFVAENDLILTGKPKYYFRSPFYSNACLSILLNIMFHAPMGRFQLENVVLTTNGL